MRRDPSLTLAGALAILGHHEPGLTGKLDKLLGGVILAAGAGAGLAAIGGPALAPLGTAAALWGWLEQKNEALSLLRQLINRASDKLLGASGYERRQLIAAAHSTIVIAALFESIGKSADIKQAMIDADTPSPARDDLIEFLYSAEIPAPSSVRGYEENIRDIEVWIYSYIGRSVRPVVTEESDLERIVTKAVERYRSHYLALAAKVPEFMVWAMLGEHAATRTQITGLRSDVAAALDANRAALARVEALLALQAGGPGDASDLRAVLARANRGVLDQPIVPLDAERYGVPVEFPAVRQIYMNPRFRITSADDKIRPADERWWDEQPSRDDLDLTLAAYVTAPDATRLPLLLLGHPGAGKSLLTKVFAARLPAYTVVRVPLRQVGANAPILDQIQQALDQATHRRVDWSRLVEQSRDTVRVVLLDGLDELLQATSNDRSAYLQEVMEFQRLEADQERPVVMLVTSRTAVADRVDIPAGTTVVKLDYFDAADIEKWLGHWREANASLIASGAVRELTPAAALRHPDLARQPLLLLMLALYAADPTFPSLDAELSTANLYQRLLDNFARREVAKKAEGRLSAEEMERRVAAQLERLAVAALAMFNRGRQDVSEAELGADLAALAEDHSTALRPAELGQRLIGEFFFVHAAEARPLSRPVGREQAVRCYEFLHATFCEFLVTRRVLNELVDVAETALAGRRGPREPDDSLLFALLSQRPLAARRSTISFATELAANLSDDERRHCAEALEILISICRRRLGADRYATYRPTPLDRVHQLAAYSANLVTLRIALDPDGAPVSLAGMLRDPGDPLTAWRSTVNLWRSGLDADGFQALVASLSLSAGRLSFRSDPETSPVFMLDILAARLVGDQEAEDRLRYGTAIQSGFVYYSDEDDWAGMMTSWLIPALGGLRIRWYFEPPPAGTPDEPVRFVADLMMRLLRWQDADLAVERDLVRYLLKLPGRAFELDTRALAAAVIRHPDLVGQIPELQDPGIFGASWTLLCMLLPVGLIWDTKGLAGEAGEVALQTRNFREHGKGSLPEAAKLALNELKEAFPSHGIHAF